MAKLCQTKGFQEKVTKITFVKDAQTDPKQIKITRNKKNIPNDRQIEKIANFLLQSNISERNIKRLEEFASHANNQEIAEIANIVLEIAKVHPRKKNRLLHLQKERIDLIEKLEELNFMLWAEND